MARAGKCQSFAHKCKESDNSFETHMLILNVIYCADLNYNNYFLS